MSAEARCSYNVTEYKRNKTVTLIPSVFNYCKSSYKKEGQHAETFKNNSQATAHAETDI